ncbi:MAG: autotransporter outer membrane beta-barrel domain-containing protein [Campylobacteraceae bacterium]|jgi:outer membrane autotransporter protein|nr:autotransporter outer membrane beta-barrel domain-containing protein [Campylobacteraceae bacterium]
MRLHSLNKYHSDIFGNVTMLGEGKASRFSKYCSDMLKKRKMSEVNSNEYRDDIFTKFIFKKTTAAVLILFGFFASNLSAACTLSSDTIYCDDTVDSSVYGTYPQNSNYVVNTTTINAYGVHADNGDNFGFNDLNINTVNTNSYAIYAQNGNISAGNNINLSTGGGNSAAVYVLQGSKITLGNDANIYTNASNSQGINARGANAANKAAVIIGNNLNILTEGSQAHSTGKSSSEGLVAHFADVDIGDNLSITTTGIGSFGMRADNNSNVRIGNGATISTTGDTGCGSCGTPGGGWFSYGVEVRRGSNVTIGNDLTVDVTGVGRNGTMAIQVLSGDSLPNGYTYLTIGDNLKAITSGPEISVGLSVNGASIVDIGDNAFIATTGGLGKGPTSAVQADSRASLGGVYYYPKITFGNNATILTTGGYSHAIYALQGYITLGDNAKIITTGDSSIGVYSWGSSSTLANSVGGAAVIIGDNAIISTSGNANLVSPAYGGSSAANAIYARQGGNITLGNNANLSVSGDKASVVYVGNYSPTALTVFPTSVVFEGTSTLNANGNNTKIFEITYANSSIDFNGETTLNSLGDNTSVFAINNLAGNFGTSNNTFNENVHFNDALNINTYGSDSKAVYLDDGYTYDFNALTINVYGPNSYALHVAGGSNLILDDETSLNAFDDSSYAIYANGAQVSSNGNILHVFGNLLSDNGGAISLAFDSQSSFVGSASLANGGVMDLSFDNSKWIVSKDSIVSNLELSNGAIVDLSYNNSPLSSPTSLIADNILGNGVFNVRVDANNDMQDKIFISNSSSGSHTVNFYDKTTGGYNPNGNLSLIVVQHLNPAGDYQANFGGHADIGAYTYNLNFDNATKSYYIGDVTPSGSIVPGSGAVLNNAAVSSIGFLTVNYLSNYINTQNILQRMGELRSNDKDNGDVWARTYFGKLGSFDDNTRIDSVGYYGIQIGADKLSYVKNGKLYAGVTFGYLKSDTDYSIGDSESVMYDFGAYALYKSDNNFYIDTLVKYVQNDNDFNTRTSNNLTVEGSGDSKGFSLSVEAGKRYDMENIYIEPQAELTYAKQGSFSVSSSNNLKTNIDGFDSYLARIGVVFGYKLKDNANLYFKTGYAKELGGKTTYSFNDAQNTQKEYKMNQNIFDNALGVTISGDNHNLYLEGGLQKGSEFDSMKANIGYRYKF